MDLSTGVTLGELLAVLVPNYTPKIRNISTSNCYLSFFNFFFYLFMTFYIVLQCLGDNWRSKASNLKKIVDSVVMYYSDELDLSLDEHLIPDVFKISENNDEGKLFTLIKNFYRK